MAVGVRVPLPVPNSGPECSKAGELDSKSDWCGSIPYGAANEEYSLMVRQPYRAPVGFVSSIMGIRRFDPYYSSPLSFFKEWNKMNTTYICVDEYDQVGRGSTLKEAYAKYKDHGGDDEINDCTFYQATEITVEVQILPVSVPVKKTAAK